MSGGRGANTATLVAARPSCALAFHSDFEEKFGYPVS
jgi:hypothetical protein